MANLSDIWNELYFLLRLTLLSFNFIKQLEIAQIIPKSVILTLCQGRTPGLVLMIKPDFQVLSCLKIGSLLGFNFTLFWIAQVIEPTLSMQTRKL